MCVISICLTEGNWRGDIFLHTPMSFGESTKASTLQFILTSIKLLKG